MFASFYHTAVKKQQIFFEKFYSSLFLDLAFYVLAFLKLGNFGGTVGNN